MEIKVSIIIPVYNAEKYLNKCLNSIIRQSYNKWELIIINDGSTDSSLKIITNFINTEKSNNRITVINKQNEGVSIARNIGIKQAKGEFLYFCDADDILTSNAIELLVNTMEKKQVTFVRSDYQAIGEKEENLFVNKKFYIRKKYAGQIMDAPSFYKHIILDEFFLWLCLFRKDIIQSNNLIFLPKCRYKEDVDFILHYLTHSKKNIYLWKQIYLYRKHSSAATVKECNYTKDIEIVKNSLNMISDFKYVDKYIDKLINRPSKLYIIKNRFLILIKYLICRI